MAAAWSRVSGAYFKGEAEGEVKAAEARAASLVEGLEAAIVVGAAAGEGERERERELPRLKEPPLPKRRRRGAGEEAADAAGADVLASASLSLLLSVLLPPGPERERGEETRRGRERLKQRERKKTPTKEVSAREESRRKKINSSRRIGASKRANSCLSRPYAAQERLKASMMNGRTRKRLEGVAEAVPEVCSWNAPSSFLAGRSESAFFIPCTTTHRSCCFF